MGQKASRGGGGRGGGATPISWWTRGHTTHTPNPQQPIKFQYKTRPRHAPDHTHHPLVKTWTNRDRAAAPSNAPTNHIARPQRTKSEPNLAANKTRVRHKKTRSGSRRGGAHHQFGYEIQNVDDFLTKATIDSPANIPVVLAHACILYQTRSGGYQEELQLPLGMVVNAVFKNNGWLYVQTPHAEEGYVNYSGCLPLGIIPPEGRQLPCWERSVFPKPSGNMTDTEKEERLESATSRSEGGFECGAARVCRGRSRSRSALGACEERSVDGLYLRAAARGRGECNVRQTLLAVWRDFDGSGVGTLRVRKGDVVALIGAESREWFWVRNREGEAGRIPAAVARHGFL